MNEIIVNDFVVNIFVLSMACTMIMLFVNNYIRYLGTKKQIKILFEEMKEQKRLAIQQHILIDHLKKTVTYFSKPENIINQCPIGMECNTAKSICGMAKETLEKIEKK